MEPEQLQAKFRGALLGVAVGDALGAPFEGTRAMPYKVLERLVQDPGPMRYTDDTHMTLGLAASLLEQQGFDGHHMAMAFAQNFAAEPWRGYGPGPPQVFHRLGQGVPWDEAGQTLFGGAGSFGNGGAMRVAPVALFAFSDLPQVAQLARHTATITHTHELGVEGAVLQACAVALLLRREPHTPFDCQAFLAALHDHVHTLVFRDALRQLLSLLPAASPTEVAQQVGNGIAAFEAVPAALYAFLRHPASFTDAVLYALSLGGDTDTIASMTGTLAGAYLGERAMPEVWRERVEGAARLQELADALLAIATRTRGDRCAGGPRTAGQSY